MANVYVVLKKSVVKAENGLATYMTDIETVFSEEKSANAYVKKISESGRSNSKNTFTVESWQVQQ